MSGALIERIRLSAYLVLTGLLGSVVWILDAAWGWSAGGWLTTRFGFHDAIASGVVHGVAGLFTLGVLINLGPRIGKYDIKGRARTFRGHNQHLTLLGLMLIFTGFYGFYAACLVIQSTVFPGWLNIYLSPTHARRDRVGDHDRLRGRLHGWVVRQQGRPVLDALGRPRGRHLGVGRRRRLPPVARLPAWRSRAPSWPSGRAPTSRSGYGSTMRSGRSRSTASAASTGCSSSGSSPAGYPTGINNIESSIGGQLVGILAFLPLAFLPGYFASLALKKMNLLRVPPEVELEGLDMAEFHQDFFPEFERVPEKIVGPDGEVLDAAPILIDAYDRSSYGKAPAGVGAES